MPYRISALNVFPVKSLSGFSPEEAYAGERGFRHDRRWMIVDENNNFITQRNFPHMCRLGVNLLPEGIELFDKDAPDDKIYIPHNAKRQVSTATVWSDICSVEKYVFPEISTWLEDKTGVKCDLVYAPDTMKRKVDGRYSPLNVDTGFADSFPYLLANTASLKELNKRAGQEYEMIRFRPNIIFEGDTAFQEDSWKKIKIGSVIFHVVKPCARCVMITIDPATGKKSPEPLKTLAAFRQQNNKVLFAQNMVAENEGVVKAGDQLEVLEWEQGSIA